MELGASERNPVLNLKIYTHQDYNTCIYGFTDFLSTSMLQTVEFAIDNTSISDCKKMLGDFMYAESAISEIFKPGNLFKSPHGEVLADGTTRQLRQLSTEEWAAYKWLMKPVRKISQ